VRSRPTVGPDKDEGHLKREIPIGGITRIKIVWITRLWSPKHRL
jgi:hypothetical protein